MLRNGTLIGFGLLIAFAIGGCDKGPQGNKAAPNKNNSNSLKKDSTKKNVVRTLDGKVYGKKLTQSSSIPISQIMADPKKYEGKTVRVEGMVTDVCPRRGCWINVAGDKPGQKMRFKVRDGVITFPMKEKGNYAVVEGVVKVRKLSLERTRAFYKHMAEEKGEKFDPKSITEGKTIVSLAGQGAVIRDRK